MKLERLLENVETKEIIGSVDIEIEGIYLDSKEITKNSLFICMEGMTVDGHMFVQQAERYGAVAVVCEKHLETSLTQIIVEDSRRAMSDVAREFYGNADSELIIIGVTGTNGKTTTSHLIYNVLNDCGIKTGLIGTLGVYYGKEYIESTLTTPDPLELHKHFRSMVDCGAKMVVMEVSAHALYFDKIKGIKFKVGVFTNFTQDHLDFFGSMEKYKQAKLKFFTDYKCDYVMTNSDDDLGLEIASKIKNSITYGIENPADVFAIRINEKKNGTSFVLNLFDMIYQIETKLVGRFNVYNIMAAMATVAILGVSSDKIMESIKKINTISGRLEQVYNGEYAIFIDYAHTPDGLKKSLTSLKKVCKGRLVCVFGCGGNRDKSKRRKMGKISGEIADFTVVTSDNPRYEEPMEIISEIEKGILEVSKKYVLVQDREEAIRYSINYAKNNDVILIAGKGCEKYQEILGAKRMYNDKDAVEEVIRGKQS